jgi:hypothetical protein
LIFLVNDRFQGMRLSGEMLLGSNTPIGTVTGNFTFIYLKQYQRADELSRKAVVTYLMALLSTRYNLFHAPSSLAAGVALYEQDRYLGTRGYLVPLSGIAARYSTFSQREAWRESDGTWNRLGAHPVLAYQDALAMVHVIVGSHGGAPALIRLGKAFKRMRVTPGQRYTSEQLDQAFRTALGVTFDTVAAEARAYVAGGSWKYG